MSCFFEMSGRTVWNPANEVARLYVEQAAALARVLGVASGVGEIVNDECELDEEVFQGFVAKLLEHPRAGHPVFRELTEGFLATSLVLVERGGLELRATGFDEDGWRVRTARLSREMPRD